MRLLILAISILSFNGVFALEAISIRFNYWQLLNNSDRVAAYDSSAINLLDGDTNTAARVFYILGQQDPSIMEVVLSTNINVDKIVFINGNTNRGDSFAVHEMNGAVYQRIGSNDVLSVDGKIELSNGQNRQEFKLERTACGYKWRFEVLSVYSSAERMMKYGMANIAEIEFWHKGEKYPVADLESLKKEFKELWISRVTNIINYYFSSVNNAMIMTNSVTENWKQLGVDLKFLEAKTVQKRTRLHLELTVDPNITEAPVNAVLSGNFILGRLNGRISLTQDTTNKIKQYHFIDGIKLGEWLVDDWGRLWVKVGNGAWKKETGPDFSFQGTDLAGLMIYPGVDFK